VHASTPQVIVEPETIDEIVDIMRDRERFPSPVRAIGSNHSTTPCGTVEGGTLVRMGKMNRILDIAPDSVTAEAGALYIDVAHAVRRHGLQLHVNLEIGNISIGAAACCETKDATFPGEYGAVCAYAKHIRLVTANGDVLEIGEDDPELLRAARSSYGLLGIVCEATFALKPLQAMSVEHRAYSLDQFESVLPSLYERDASMMFYIFPFLDSILVESRAYHGELAARRPNRAVWRMRNSFWRDIHPIVSHAAAHWVRPRRAGYAVLDAWDRVVLAVAPAFLRSKTTNASDQQVRFPPKAPWWAYTFSIWTFPEETFVSAMRDYFLWIREYSRRTGFRPNMPHVGYWIAQDRGSLFSYAHDGQMMSLDPIATGGGPEWLAFLDEYNEFCSAHGAFPLFNQTPLLRPEHVRKAYGSRIDEFEGHRRRLDPDDRLLSAHFRTLLGQ
jgi:FAD/FMN-containing dehydrogenase